MADVKRKRTKKHVDVLPWNELDEFKPYIVSCWDCRTYYDVLEEGMLTMCPNCGSMSHRHVSHHVHRG